MGHQLLSEYKFRKFSCFYVLFTVLMNLTLEKHITYFAFNFNDVGYRANAPTIDSATSKFNFVIGRLGIILISPNIFLLYAIFSTTITPINEDTTDLTNLIIN